MAEETVRLTDIDDGNVGFFWPFVPEGMRRLYGKPSCLFIGAVDGKSFASGVLIAFYVRHWEILWIYVAEGCRRRGMAAAMLNGLAEHYLDRERGAILAYFTEDMDRGALIPLFRKAGYRAGEVEGGGYFETEIGKVGGCGSGPRKLGHAVPIRRLTKDQMRKLGGKLMSWRACRQIPLPLEEDECEACSHAAVSGGEITGACLVTRDNGRMRISLLHAEGGRPEVLMETLMATVRKMKEDCPERMRVGALALNGSAASLCRRLAGDVEQSKAYKAAFGHE